MGAKSCEFLGWEAVRQAGSHIIMVKAGELVTLSVPDHREIAKGTLSYAVTNGFQYLVTSTFCVAVLMTGLNLSWSGFEVVFFK